MSTPTPAPRRPMDDPEVPNPSADLSVWMAELDTSDSQSLADSAVGLILGCVDETDSTAKATQLELEMIQSLEKLTQPNATEPGEEPPPARP